MRFWSHAFRVGGPTGVAANSVVCYAISVVLRCAGMTYRLAVDERASSAANGYGGGVDFREMALVRLRAVLRRHICLSDHKLKAKQSISTDLLYLL